jgi:hypothetical protein
MNPDDFERLCARLIVATNGHVIQAVRYGAFSQAQGGIDIIAASRASRKQIVAECKRAKDVASGDIKRWTDRFLKVRISPVDRFILAVTANFEANSASMNGATP